ncbi:MAG: BatA domain-containing protein [Vicinamibacterales bacterium]
MSFLAPLFFLGLGAIAIPVIVHLIQRERKRVVAFPSLMFVQKIPYQSVRRRRIRHWPLLILRALAIALIVAAFARPFLEQGAAALAAAGGSREVVILLDQSASMGYADRFARAQEAARGVIGSLATGDRATLVLFGRNAEESMRATSDQGRLSAAVDTATVTAGATRYGPALKLAESILTQSTAPRKEAVLISDFQKSGWSGAEDVHFGETLRLTPMPIGEGPSPNVAVSSVTFGRATFSGEERVTVTAGVANKGNQAVNDLPVTLEVAGQELETVRATVGANASASVAFAPFTVAEPVMRGAVKAGSDPLPADNTFHFVITPEKPVSILLVDAGDRSDASFYLSRALAVGTAPAFQVESVPVNRLNAAALQGRAVVILNDTGFPSTLAGGALKSYVENGGGLLVVAGEKTGWPEAESDLLPAKFGAPVDRLSGRGGAIGYLDYSHPAFEVFKAPRSGDFSAAHVLRYRSLEVAPTDRVLARFDDGVAAAAERRVGAGRVIVFGTSLDDSWNDLPLKPVYLPLVHQLVKYLAQYEAPASWRTVGQVVDLSVLLKGKASRLVITPSTERVSIPANEPGLLELSELGVYEIRAAGSTGERPDRIAVNIDPAESDLAPMDPPELVAAVTGRAADAPGTAPQAAEINVEDVEKQQGLWWYLLVAGLLLLAAEMVLSNRLSREERFL